MHRGKGSYALRFYLALVLFVILAPMVILLFWTFASRWPWPHLYPTTLSLRGIEELFAPHAKVLPVLLSSIGLSLAVAFLSAIVATMTARALVFYDFPGKRWIDLLGMAPILVPSSVFAMGIHVVLIRMSLADTMSGVILVHLIYTLPYTTNIMKDLTHSIGKQMEDQAYVLGVSPWKAFFHVSLPLISPGILASISMAYVVSFSQYFITLLIGGGKVRTFSTLMVPFIGKGDRTLGSAYGLVFILSTLIVFMVINQIIRLLPYQEKGGGL